MFRCKMCNNMSLEDKRIFLPQEICPGYCFLFISFESTITTLASLLIAGISRMCLTSMPVSSH